MGPVLLIVTALVFAMVFAMVWAFPGDPARAFAGSGEVLDEQQLALIRKEHHFDKPVPVQYALWLHKTLQGDLDRSTQTSRRVSVEIADRAQVTFGLGLLSVPGSTSARCGRTGARCRSPSRTRPRHLHSPAGAAATAAAMAVTAHPA